MKTKRVAKFYSKSLILPVLEHIRQGIISADIAIALKISPQLVTYYIHKAENLGYVTCVFRDTFKSYELTEAGKKFLDQYDIDRVPLIRAENIRFRAPVTHLPNIPIHWNKIDMNNWIQYGTRIDGVDVRLNMGKSPVLEFLPRPKDGDDPFGIFTILVFECINVILELNDEIGIRVGPLELGSRAEWLVFDPAARMFCKVNGQVTYDGLAVVNASKPRRIGELEFFDPRALLSYLLMPSQMKQIDLRIERIEAMLRTLFQADTDQSLRYRSHACPQMEV